VKSRTCVTGLILLLAVIPARLAAQEQDRLATHYRVADIGTLGGTFGEANAVYNRGWVVGDATLPGDTVRHAFLWRKGVKRDLRTLGGPNSIALFPLNDRGEITGFSDTSTPDPSSEDFCGFGTNLTCLPFLWRHGAMTQLSTLGGNNGEALEVNNRGHVVGVAENTTFDTTCVDTPQVLQFKHLGRGDHPRVSYIFWRLGRIRYCDK
jgi:probable HAF family extracellular repeat protein